MEDCKCSVEKADLLAMISTAATEIMTIDHLFFIHNPDYYRCADSWIFETAPSGVGKLEATKRTAVSHCTLMYQHLLTDARYCLSWRLAKTLAGLGSSHMALKLGNRILAKESPSVLDDGYQQMLYSAGIAILP